MRMFPNAAQLSFARRNCWVPQGLTVNELSVCLTHTQHGVDLQRWILSRFPRPKKVFLPGMTEQKGTIQNSAWKLLRNLVKKPVNISKSDKIPMWDAKMNFNVSFTGKLHPHFAVNFSVRSFISQVCCQFLYLCAEAFPKTRETLSPPQIKARQKEPRNVWACFLVSLRRQTFLSYPMRMAVVEEAILVICGGFFLW